MGPKVSHLTPTALLRLYSKPLELALWCTAAASSLVSLLLLFVTANFHLVARAVLWNVKEITSLPRGYTSSARSPKRWEWNPDLPPARQCITCPLLLLQLRLLLVHHAPVIHFGARPQLVSVWELVHFYLPRPNCCFPAFHEVSTFLVTSVSVHLSSRWHCIVICPLWSFPIVLPCFIVIALELTLYSCSRCLATLHVSDDKDFVCVVACCVPSACIRASSYYVF